MKSPNAHERIDQHIFIDHSDVLDTSIMLEIYRFMLRLRLIEERIATEYHPSDQMRCPVHLCIGQEAVPGALSILVGTDDYLFSHHRSHGHYLAKGCSLSALIAELYGKETGANRGFAGSQDISNASSKFYAGAILAGTIGIAIGAAASNADRSSQRRVFCCFGEAASEQGIFWEAINYASLKQLPIVFICENNLYATYSHTEMRVSNLDLVNKVKSFGVDGEQVFGNDVVAVYQAIHNAIQLNNVQPYFINAITYRLSSHVGPEDDSNYYREENEISYWKTLCPLANLFYRLENVFDIDLSKINGEINKEIDVAFRAAQNDGFQNVTDWENLNIDNNDTNPLPNLDNDLTVGTHREDTVPGPY